MGLCGQERCHAWHGGSAGARIGWGRTTVLFCPCSQHRHPHVPVTGRRSPCSAHIWTCNVVRWPALSPAASPPRSCGGQGPEHSGQAQRRGEELGTEPAGAAVQPLHSAVHPASEDCVCPVPAPAQLLAQGLCSNHTSLPPRSIHSASTCQGLCCSSSKAEEDTVQPLLSLSLARELEGAAGSSKLQLHAVHPSPHPCTHLCTHAHACTHTDTPAPTPAHRTCQPRSTSHAQSRAGSPGQRQASPSARSGAEDQAKPSAGPGAAR